MIYDYDGDNTQFFSDWTDSLTIPTSKWRAILLRLCSVLFCCSWQQSLCHAGSNAPTHHLRTSFLLQIRRKMSTVMSWKRWCDMTTAIFTITSFTSLKRGISTLHSLWARHFIFDQEVKTASNTAPTYHNIHSMVDLLLMCTFSLSWLEGYSYRSRSPRVISLEMIIRYCTRKNVYLALSSAVCHHPPSHSLTRVILHLCHVVYYLSSSRRGKGACMLRVNDENNQNRG